MKKLVGLVAAVMVALLVVASPAFALAGVRGTATTDNTILKVQVGSTTVALGIDTAQALNASTIKAFSKVITGTVGDQQLGGAKERTASKSSESGSDSLGIGTQYLGTPPLASINVTGGSVASTVATDHVSSAVEFAAGALSALGGFTNIATMQSTTSSRVDGLGSHVSRLITLGNAEILDLRTLLGQLGINPLAMACSAIDATASQLSVVTAAACPALTSVTDQILAGNTQFVPTGDVLSTLELALAPLCALAPAGTCDAINAQIASAQAQIDGYTSSPPDACATLSDALATVSGSLNTIAGTLQGLSGGALGDLTALIGTVTGAIPSVNSAQAMLDSACNTLLGIVDSVLDTPLLQLDGISVSMNLSARKNPLAVSIGSIGAAKVGNVPVVSGADLVALGPQLQAASATVSSALASVFAATGLGLPAPTVDFLKVATDRGRRSDGTYFASASMSAADIGLGSVTVPLGSLPFDLAPLAGVGSFAPMSVTPESVTTQPVSVQAAKFTGVADWKAGRSLPVTGVSTTGLLIVGLIALAGAGLVVQTLRRNAD